MTATETKIKDMTNVGTALAGDYFVGERTPGTSVIINYTTRLSDDTTPTLAANITLNGHNVTGTGLWQGSVHTVTYGGTGNASNAVYGLLAGGATPTGALQSLPTGNSGQLLQSAGNTALAAWTTSTYPSTATTANTRLKANGTNWVATTTTMPDTGTSGKLIRGNGTNYVETTATYPDTFAQYDLLYASTANTLSSLTTNSGYSILTTNNVGSLGWSGVANNNVFVFLGTPTSANLASVMTDETGTGSLVFGTSPTFITPILGTPTSGNLSNCTALSLTAGVSGVLPVANGGTNASSAGVTAFNNITGYTASGATGTTSTNLVFSTSPTLITPLLGTPTSGTLTNCTGLPSGSGIICTATNNNASASQLGEFISAALTQGSQTALTNNTVKNIVSILLTAGDWDVHGIVFFQVSVASTQLLAWTSQTSATLSDASITSYLADPGATSLGTSTALLRLSLSGTTTVYLSAYASFSSGAVNVSGLIEARRVR